MGDEELAGFTEERHTIQDNAGTTYSVRFMRLDDGWDLRLLLEEREIGEANCEFHGENLYLGNIEIYGIAAPPAAPQPAAPQPAASQPAAQNYRGRGAGAAFLRLIIDQARLSGRFRQITGMLHPQNLQDTPHLPDWYRNQGFTVRMTPDGRGGTIRLNLDPDEGAA